MADAASGVLSPAKMPRRAAESVAFDAAMYPFPIGVSFWSEMSGLTSSRVNCAKPREQLYGGVAFGALPRGMPCCERRVPSLRCLVALFVALNTLNYVDRGIIPGASEEFEAFICDSRAEWARSTVCSR